MTDTTGAQFKNPLGEAHVKLASTDGKRVAFMRPFAIPDAANPEETYLWRLRIIQTPWFALYLHKINTPDGDRHPHDHPFNFWSLILKGGYNEHVIDPEFRTKVHRRGWFSFHKMPKTHFHSITRLLSVPTWTLIFVGARTQDWGFLTDDGWVDHATYIENIKGWKLQ